jgi:hypothetical protein
MSTATIRKNSANAAIDRAVRDALGTVADRHIHTRAAFERLLRQARRSDLLCPAPSGGRSGAKGYGEIVSGLLALAVQHRQWIRPVDAWEPAGANPLPRFTSLARHLFAAYPVPAFMTPVWIKGMGTEARRQQRWFMQIGVGRNIRHADLPLPYTKRMAHHFLQAPDHVTVEAALRWGQVRGLGGSKGLALALATTRLGQSFESEGFWVSVVQFLVNQPEFDLVQVGQVVNYLHHQRFVPQEVHCGERETVLLGPQQPNLSMKGRTPRSLLRQVGDWRERSRLPKKVASLRWNPAGIEEYRHVEQGLSDGFRCWTIRELTSSEDLYREGEAMQHCVARYISTCARRQTSVWSMRFDNGDRRFRVLTIEVNLATRTICQARRRGNAPPNEKIVGVLRRWAEQGGLTLGFWSMGAFVRD